MKRPVLGPIDPVTGRPLYLPGDVVSSTDATGLEPTPPQNDAEAESFAEHFAGQGARRPQRRATRAAPACGGGPARRAGRGRRAVPAADVIKEETA